MRKTILDACCGGRMFYSDYLKYDLNKMPEDKVIRYKYYGAKVDSQTGTIIYEAIGTKVVRPYKFKREEFIKEE